jgi:hypothetical protein
VKLSGKRFAKVIYARLPNGILQKLHGLQDPGAKCDRDFVNSVEHYRFTAATSNANPVPASLTIEVLATDRPHYHVMCTNIE